MYNASSEKFQNIKNTTIFIKCYLQATILYTDLRSRLNLDIRKCVAQFHWMSRSNVVLANDIEYNLERT